MSTITKKLKAYSAAAGAMTAFAGVANGQIVHTDIVPDSVITDGETFSLNMDNAGPAEFEFERFTYLDSLGNPEVTFSMVNVLAPTSAIVGSIFSSSYPFPFALNNGDSIAASAGANWRDGSINGGTQYLGVVYGSYNYCNFLGVDKFMGVRFNISGQPHYGWVRLYVSPGADTIIVKEYAYQTLPNVGLTAGQLVGIETQETTPVRVFAYNNMLHINRESNGDAAVITVYNSMGQTVYTEQSAENNYTHSLENLTAGIYTVSVTTSTGVTTRKIYIH
jgi:Secretion system C-terminal sorting domain